MDASGLPNERSAAPYLFGLALALILTAVPFGVVYFDFLQNSTTLIVIAFFAVAQILVHLRFFLHIGFDSTPTENLVVMAFAIVLMCIMVGGSLWIMFDLDWRMMVQ
ncbi:cytochrome o ubiquinol oxidase subunit IV [Methyloligella solikamskensis]|uniref:Cytochrome bo(3) ubiquinol oxidase subunit 4 n=1 Tax=Methyloligella solikamskensis TaxID=1177756 RepID=A0ABW3JA86_9HYPH